MKVTLLDVWQALNVFARVSSPAGPMVTRPLSAIVIDSREAEPGSLFVALPGEHTDGHNFVAHAFSRGALVALVSRPVDGPYLTLDARLPDQELSVQPGEHVCILVDDTQVALQQIAAAWRTRFAPRVIGVTGSVGKTTTKEIIAAVLGQRYVTLKSPGNLNNEIGLPLTVLQMEERHERVVLEMGMYDVGEIAQLCRIARPHVGVITNVGPVHLERLGTVERVAQAKAELVQALPADGVAVLNADDPMVSAMAAQTRARVFRYGLLPDADLWADDIAGEGLEGIRFRFHYQGDLVHVRVPLLGRHSVHTALRATAVGLIEGLSWDEIVPGLQNVETQLRLMVVRAVNGATLLDDTYNASPASTLAALNLLADLAIGHGRRIAVLGDMLELGSYEEEGHRIVRSACGRRGRHSDHGWPTGSPDRRGGARVRSAGDQGSSRGKLRNRACQVTLDARPGRCRIGQGIARIPHGRDRHCAELAHG